MKTGDGPSRDAFGGPSRQSGSLSFFNNDNGWEKDQARQSIISRHALTVAYITVHASSQAHTQRVLWKWNSFLVRPIARIPGGALPHS